MNEKVREGQRGREGGGKKETKRKKLRLERNLYSCHTVGGRCISNTTEKLSRCLKALARNIKRRDTTRAILSR